MLNLSVLTGLSPKTKLIATAVIVAVVIIASLSAAWYLWKPSKVPDNKPAAAAVQSDGSIVLEKKPDPEHKAPHKVPRGDTVERSFSATVQPDKGPDATGKCPPVTVDLSLVRNKDQTKRVIASSSDGKVISGIDIPVEDAIPLPEPKLWAAGAAYSSKGNVGVWVDRDLGWMRLGTQVNQVKDLPSQGWEGWIKAGIKF